MDAVLSGCPFVLGPALAFEGRPRFFGMDSPPLLVAGIESIGKDGSSVAVVDGDCGPSCLGNRITVIAGKTWTAGNNAGNAPPPSASSAIGGFLMAVACVFGYCTRPMLCNSSAMCAGINNRCFLDTPPIRVSVKWLVATTSTFSINLTFAGLIKKGAKAPFFWFSPIKRMCL